ncbi:MAG: hypothetical protein QM703_15900 [Gemmatales bacterium]
MTIMKQQHENLSNNRLWHCDLQRLLWIVLLLVHIAPVAAVVIKLCSSPSLHHVLTLLTLLSIVGLSVCKVFDVPWLRISLGRRSWISLIALALWIHGDFVADHLPEVILIESAVTVTAVCLIISGRIARLFNKWFDFTPRMSIQHYWQRLYQLADLPSPRHYFVSLPPRGPPLA